MVELSSDLDIASHFRLCSKRQESAKIAVARKRYNADAKGAGDLLARSLIVAAQVGLHAEKRREIVCSFGRGATSVANNNKIKQEANGLCCQRLQYPIALLAFPDSDSVAGPEELLMPRTTRVRPLAVATYFS